MFYRSKIVDHQILKFKTNLKVFYIFFYDILIIFEITKRKITIEDIED